MVGGHQAWPGGNPGSPAGCCQAFPYSAEEETSTHGFKGFVDPLTDWVTAASHNLMLCMECTFQSRQKPSIENNACLNKLCKNVAFSALTLQGSVIYRLVVRDEHQRQYISLQKWQHMWESRCPGNVYGDNKQLTKPTLLFAQYDNFHLWNLFIRP